MTYALFHEFEKRGYIGATFCYRLRCFDIFKNVRISVKYWRVMNWRNASLGFVS